MRILLRRKKSLLLGVILLALVAAAGGLVALKRTKTTVAADNNYRPIQTINAVLRIDGPDNEYSTTGLAHTNYFRLEGAGINTAWCAQADKNTPWFFQNQEVGVAIYDVNDSAPDAFKLWFKILYYSDMRYIGHDGYAFSNAEIHQALSRTYAATGNTGFGTLDARAVDIIQQVSSLPLPRGTNYLYVAYNTDATQSVMTYYHWDISYINLEVTKEWADDNNKYKTRPESITVYLEKDGQATGDYAILAESNGWSGKFDSLEANHTYTVSEQVVKNYDGDVKCYDKSDGNRKCDITNSLTKEFISLPVEKIWKDDGNKKRTRPSSIRVYLVENGVQTSKYVDLSDANGWKASFDGLEKENKKYSVSEQEVSGYTGNVDCKGGTCYITNTLTGTRSIPVTKIWEDYGKASKRPESVTVTISGSDGTTRTETITPAEDEDKANPNTWKKTFGGLPKYTDSGSEITYTVTESLPDGSIYTSSGTTGDMNNGFSMTNTYEAKAGLYVVKQWLDGGNRGVVTRPESITFNILKNGEVYDTIVLTEADKYVPSEREMEAMTPERWEIIDNSWVRYIDGLEKYDESGEVIEWRAEEVAVNGYDLIENLCQTYYPITDLDDGAVLQHSCVSTNRRVGKVNINVEKEWSDDDDHDGVRPTSVRFIVRQFYWNSAGTSKLPREYGMITVSADTNWQGSMNGLPRFDGKGREYTYDLYEINVGPYMWEQLGDAERDENGNYTFRFKNNYTAKTNIGVIKCWEDGKNTSGVRPASLNFPMVTELHDKDTGELIETVGTTVITLTPADAVGDCWQKTVTNLPLNDENDNRYVYIVEEDKSWIEETDYEAYGDACNAEENGWVCEYTNRLEGSTTFSGTKTWKDDKNKKGLRPNPENFEITLYRMSETEDEAVVDLDPTWTRSNDGETWTYTFSDLPKYDDEGFEYAYRTEEHQTEIDLSNGDKYVSRDAAAVNNFENVLTGEIDYCGKKVWRDQDAPEDFRPEDIVVTLTRDDGEEYTTTVSSASSEEALVLCDEEVEEEGEIWYFVFDGLDKYDDEGREYGYTLSEESDIDSYVTTIAQSKNIIYNDYESKPIRIEVNKIWLNDKAEDRPDYIEVTLYRNGSEYEKRRLDSKSGWTYAWENLDGNFEWTISEDVQIENYGTEIREEVDDDGNIVFNIYNTKAPDTRDRGISKYVFMVSGVLLGGFAVSRRMIARR